MAPQGFAGTVGLFVFAALALGGCAEDSGGVSDVDDHAATRALEITVSSGSDAELATWTLTCDPPGGNHPDAEAACRVLEEAAHPFAPVPADMACTQIYGGPETATITGTWDGEPVSARYRRTDGCEIARWDALAAVLAPPG